MKPIHLITNAKDPVRPIYGWIRVKEGFAYATNGAAAIKMPVEELFGRPLHCEEELYFEGVIWNTNKMHKASSIQQDLPEYTYTAFDRRGNVLGRITALNLEQFSKKFSGQYFTQLETIIENSLQVNTDRGSMQCEPEHLNNLCKAFGVSKELFYIRFYGNFAKITSSESKALGLIFTYEAPEEQIIEEKKTDIDNSCDDLM